MSAERSESQRSLIEGSTLSGIAVMAIVLFGMVNYLSFRHYARWDWTSSKLYTLSEKSQAVLAGLDRDIEGIIFLSPASELYAPADELLSRYEAASPKYFKKRVIDPAKNLLEARRLVEQHDVQRSNVIVIAAGDERRVIDEFDLAEYDYSGAQFGQGPSLKEFKGEQMITSAILELVEAKKPKILFTTGHGEGSIDSPGDPRSLSQAKDLLGRDNFELEEWDSAGKIEVPADTDLVVIAGPTTNFFEPELEVISRYLDHGGRVLVLLDPVIEGTEISDAGLSQWLRRFGVAVGNDLVIDPETQLPFFGPETVYSASYGVHPIVEDLEQTGTRVLMAVSRSVGKADDAPGEYEIEELVTTSSSAWGETDLANLEDLRPDEGETEGTISLGVAVSYKVGVASEADGEEGESDLSDGSENPDEAPDDMGPGQEEESDESESDGNVPEARLVVFGDLDFAANSQLANAANGALLLNTFNWLVQREQLISIEGKKPEATSLSLSSSELSTIYLLVLIVMPGLAVFTGVWVFLRRRR